MQIININFIFYILIFDFNLNVFFVMFNFLISIIYYFIFSSFNFDLICSAIVDHEFSQFIKKANESQLMRAYVT